MENNYLPLENIRCKECGSKSWDVVFHNLGGYYSHFYLYQCKDCKRVVAERYPNVMKRLKIMEM